MKVGEFESLPSAYGPNARVVRGSILLVCHKSEIPKEITDSEAEVYPSRYIALGSPLVTCAQGSKSWVVRASELIDPFMSEPSKKTVGQDDDRVTMEPSIGLLSAPHTLDAHQEQIKLLRGTWSSDVIYGILASSYGESVAQKMLDKLPVAVPITSNV